MAEPDIAITGTDQGVGSSQQGPSTPAPDPSNPEGNNTGVAVPPNDPINQSSQEPPHPPQTQSPQVNAQIQPSGPQQAPDQTMPQLPPAPKGVDPNNPNAYHPSVQKAGLFHTIAEALAGGPRFDVKINPNTGETEYTRRRMSTGDILAGIALEAVSGSAAGLGVQNGPGNLGRAAAAGFNQSAQQQQQVRQQQLQQATTDYARHAQILETNMRMWQNAQTVGRQDLQDHKDYVGQFSDLATRVQNEFPGIVKARVPESQLSQYHVTKDGAIPVGVSPRPDPNQPDGQARGQFGQKLWDNEYLVIDPSFKADGLLTDADKADAAKYHLQGFVDGNGKPIKLPDNVSLSLGMVLNYKSQIASIKAFEGELNNFHDTLDKGTGGTGTPDGKSIFSLYNNDPNKLADFITQHEGGKPGDRNTRNNNPGNLIADVSWSGPKDDANLPTGQAPFRKYDSPDAGRAALVKQIQLDQSRNPNMTPEQFFDKYDHNDAATYAQAARQFVGAGTGSTSPAPSTPKPDTDMAKAIAADPTLPGYINKAQALINAAGGDVPKGLEAYAKADPTGSAKVIPLFGGNDTLQKYTQTKLLQLDQQKSDITEARAVSVAAQKQQQKDQADKEANSSVRTILQGPASFEPPPDAINMKPNDLRSYLESHHAGVGEDGLAPDTLEYLQGVAKYDLKLGSSPVRVWAKGSPRELDQQQVGEYIRKFINPNFSDQAAKTWNEWNDAGNTKGGQIIYNAGVATQHLDLLREAGAALRNGNVAYLNRIGNEFGLNLEGKAAPAQFQAIADAASREVSKVAAGQATPYTHEIESSRETLSRDYSPEAINGVIDSYTKLMGGRVREADDLVARQTGRHLDNFISPAATASFQKAGQATPWVVGQLPKGQGTPLTDPNVLQQYFQAAGGKTNPQAIQLATQWARKNGWNIPDPTGTPIKPSAQPVQQNSAPPPNEEANNSAAQ